MRIERLLATCTIAAVMMTQLGCEAPPPPDREVYKPRIAKTAAEEAKEKPKHPAALPLPNGSPVKIEVLAEGKGKVAAKGKSCHVHYVGWLSDGTEFDSSEGKSPYVLELGAGMVIKGWEQGIEGMKVGEKRRLTIPPDLAYGPKGRGMIPGDATLVFELELKAVDD